MTTRIHIRKPDDWHLHVRDGAMLKGVLPFTAKHFGRDRRQIYRWMEAYGIQRDEKA